MRKCVNSSACIAGTMHAEADMKLFDLLHLIQYLFHTQTSAHTTRLSPPLVVALLPKVFEVAVAVS
jgi:hypothetical protein